MEDIQREFRNFSCKSLLPLASSSTTHQRRKRGVLHFDTLGQGSIQKQRHTQKSREIQAWSGTMASAFWGVTGFFIILEVAFVLAVLFSGGTKDDKQ